MASSAGHVVVLQVNGLERPVFEKLAKTATVKPGHLLEISTGKVQPNGTAGAANVRMVAVEHGFRNTSGTTLNIDTAFPQDDIVPFIYPQSGDLLYMVLKQGQNVAIGAKLEAATGGELQAISTGALVGIAEEAVDATAAAARIRVRMV
jgi:hypothetical protein